MRIAFYVVMLFIALVSAVDAMTGGPRKGEDSVLKTFGVKQRKTESVIVFGISTAALLVLLLSEVIL